MDSSFFEVKAGKDLAPGPGGLLLRPRDPTMRLVNSKTKRDATNLSLHVKVPSPTA